MTTAPPSSDAPASAIPPTPGPRPGDRFFAWVADQGVVRTDGWLGGVCSGLAARWSIDPLIARGVAVISSLFALPAAIVYALAWGVLPGPDGRSHAADLERGRFSFAQGAIAAMLIAGMMQVLLAIGTVTFVATGGVAWPLLLVPFLALLCVVVGGVIAAAFVRAASRAPGEASDSAPDPASPPREPSPLDDGRPEALEPESASPRPASDDLDAWRVQHAQWREQDRLWRRSRHDADRAARDIARRERHDVAASFSREAAERRRMRRASRPRASAAFVALAVGTAALGATAVASTSSDDAAIGRGLLVAALVLAVAMIVAGILRRRSGFLAFLTTTALGVGAAAVAMPVAIDLHLGSAGVSNLRPAQSSAADPFRQVFGITYVTLAGTSDPAPVHISKQGGDMFVSIDPGVEVELDAVLEPDVVSAFFLDGHPDLAADRLERTVLSDGRTRLTGVLPARSTPSDANAAPPIRQVLEIEQHSGYVSFARISPPGAGEIEGAAR